MGYTYDDACELLVCYYTIMPCFRNLAELDRVCDIFDNTFGPVTEYPKVQIMDGGE